MTSLSSKSLILSFISLAVASQACTLASPTEVEMKPVSTDQAAIEGASSSGGSSSGSTGTPATKCDAKLVKVDVSKLTACGDGAGHCYAKSKVPGALAFKPCDKADEICVPDTVLTAGGGKLKSCKVEVLKGAAGACLPLGTMPEGADKEQAKGNLKQDACDEGELCGPCQNPLANNADTGLCQAIGVADGDCGGGATDAPAAGGDAPKAAPAAACCGGKGSCMDGTTLGETADHMSKDTCSGDNLVCAPASLTAGKATTCSAGLVMGKGICMDGCFNDTLKNIGAHFLDQDTCPTNEMCVPCLFAKKMAPDGAKVPGCE